MKAQEYQHYAAMTEKALPHPMRLLHSQIGVAGEFGEIAELIQDYVAGGSIKLDVMEEEIGDSCWYVAIIANIYGIRFEDLIPENPLATPEPDLEGWLVHAAQALGEFCDAIKREVIYERKDMASTIKDKAYNYMTWIVILCKLTQIDLNLAFDANISKLRKRYPDNKFLAADANARADKA